MPRLSVVMPVYNGKRFLKDAIQSVLNQNFSDFEFLIIDDKSKDNSVDIITAYKDKRIRFVQNKENLGQMQTLNVGIGLSHGQYIARMDQDDISLRERFKKEVEILDEFGDIGLVYSNSFIIDEEGRRKKKTLFDFTKPPRIFLLDKFLKRNFIAGNTVMIRKTILESIGPLNPALKTAGEYELYLRLAQKYKIHCIDEPLAEYRVHGTNTSKDMENNIKEDIEALTNLESNIEDKHLESTLNKAISWYKANLAICYLFKHNRQFCKNTAKEALRMNKFNLKALAAIFMAIFLSKGVIGYLESFRKGMLE